MTGDMEDKTSVLRKFRLVNNLTQKELGDYLGVKNSYICRMERGDAALSKEKIGKLIDNPYGWDASMLVNSTPSVTQTITNGNNNTQVVGSDDQREHEIEIAQLRAALEKVIEERDRYWELLSRIMEAPEKTEKQ